MAVPGGLTLGVLPFRATLNVGGHAEFDVAAFNVTITANGINTAVVNIAVGSVRGFNPVGAIGFPRGTEAAIYIYASQFYGEFSPLSPKNTLLTNLGGFTLFRGYVEDFGPANVSYGSYTVQIVLVGRLAVLASGTLQLSNLVPAGHLDTNVNPTPLFKTNASYTMNPSRASSELHGEFKRMMLEIATDPSPNADSLGRQIVDYFGTSVNNDAASVLRTIDGVMSWKGGVTQSDVNGFVDAINGIYRTDAFYESFFNRYLRIGDAFKFKLLETGNWIYAMPHTPFLSRGGWVRNIRAHTYSSLQWRVSSFKNYLGCVLYSGGATREDSVGASSLMIGKFQRNVGGGSGARKFGRIHIAAAPGFIVALEEFTGNAGVTNARSYVSSETSSSVADAYAQYLCWQLNFEQRHITVSCPTLRTDIAPLTQVAVDYPNIPQILGAQFDDALYGVVQSVTISADLSSPGRAITTTYDIGYVRSGRQQDEIDSGYASNGHPFFGNFYYGGRLDGQEPSNAASSS